MNANIESFGNQYTKNKDLEQIFSQLIASQTELNDDGEPGDHLV